MDSGQKEYRRLHALSKEAATLDSLGALLHWDQETHMPPSGAGARAKQLEMVAELAHKKKTSKAFESALASLIDLESGQLQVSGLTAAQEAAVREWRRDFYHATALPKRFVKRYVATTSEALEVWRRARQEARFSLFAPHLEKLKELWLEKSERLGYKEHPYDAHLDQYEPGGTMAHIQTLFDSLRIPLSKLRTELLEQRQPDFSFLQKRYEKNRQMEVAREFLTVTGFTDERGAFDLTTHPFCTSLHPTDGRVTTRVNEHDPMENLLATLHEGGHYLYEVSLPEEAWGSPLGEACSTAVHESQSRWWEAMVGQSQPFWEYALPILKKSFPSQLGGTSLSDFLRAINALRPTPIRIEADEVSYCLHVILRFDLERRLIEGALPVNDLPDAWNAGMEELLGMTPKDDAQGCLQDVHWAAGHFGYFPTYALGNLYAAQLFETFSQTHPDWGTRIAQGEFAFMRSWLQTHVHRYGRQYLPHELIQNITGSAPTPSYYLRYLTNKYEKLYSCHQTA